METKSEPLKIYFLPFMATGHMIPLVHIARLIAAKGEHVTIITTPQNAKLFEKTIDQDKATLGSHIEIHNIKFPSEEVGLPEGTENSGQVSDDDSAAKICAAGDLMQQQVEAFMEANPPHVLVTDMSFTWSSQSASRLKIPRVIFNALSIFVSCMTDALDKNNLQALSEWNSESTFVVMGLPHPITLNVKPSPTFIRFIKAQLQAEQDSIGVILNNFVDLEAEYVEHYEKLTGRKVWHVGPTSLMLKSSTNMDNDLLGNEQQHECLKWLDSQEKNSVVYISFGSLCRFTDEQLFEIACGMEASGHKFLWVVHGKDDGDDDKWLPLGFEERLKGQKRVIIYRGWAPQVLILNHPAIGGFLTHTGWNATGEAISAGVPLITMPGFGDQYYNEKLITQVRGFGVEVGDQVWTLSPYSAKKKLVRRESVESAVRRLMDGGDEANQIRKRVKELQEKAQKAVEQDGSSRRNLDEVIQHVKLKISKNEKMLKQV